MLLAISALDVAFVGALAALATAIVSPLVAWLIARQTHEHELVSERERRLFEARRETYGTVLGEAFKSIGAAHAWEVHLLAINTGGVPPAAVESADLKTWLELQARLATIASEEVMNAAERLGDTQAEFWGLTVMVRDRSLTDDEKSAIARLARESLEKRNELGREMRDDLKGRIS